jgi:hypothetical protein
MSIRTCANPRCRRAWATIPADELQPLCPTCRAGQKPLSRLRAEQKAKPGGRE